jgi:hypothetical protein
VAAAIVVTILAALAWVYRPRPAQPPQPTQEVTSVPAKPQVPVSTPSVNNPPANLPAPQPTPAQIVVLSSPDAQVYLDDAFKGQVGRKGNHGIWSATESGSYERWNIAFDKGNSSPAPRTNTYVMRALCVRNAL